jgi:FMN phosphatase YigB (HAD superfamily)
VTTAIAMSVQSASAAPSTKLTPGNESESGSVQKKAVLLFDLDGTLYDADNGYISHIRSNIFQFMVDKNIAEDVEKAQALWKPLFKQYNQTKRGLKQAGYDFDELEYWRYHRQGMDRFFERDDVLRRVLDEQLGDYDKVS